MGEIIEFPDTDDGEFQLSEKGWKLVAWLDQVQSQYRYRNDDERLLHASALIEQYMADEDAGEPVGCP
jgi:hypothetical protein